MQLSKPPKPKATRKRLKKEILSDDFKKRKIFWKNIAENFLENVPPHITSSNPAGDDGFKVNKNPLHNFLQRRSEAVCPMFTAC
jgi:hypothetical protein